MSEHANRTSSRTRRAPNRPDEVVSLAPRARTPEAPERPSSSPPANPEIADVGQFSPVVINTRIESIMQRFFPLEPSLEPSEELSHARASSEESEQPVLLSDGDSNSERSPPPLEAPDNSSEEGDYDADTHRFEDEVGAGQNAPVARQPAPRAQYAAEPSKLLSD